MRRWKILSVIAVFLLAGQAQAGIPVFDYSNFGQNLSSAIQSVMQTAKQVQQYATQLQQLQNEIQQYQNMVKNTLAPAAYVWDQAQQTMRDLLGTIDTLERYKRQAGDLDAYLAQFQDANYYRSSPCFGPNGCTQAQWDALKRSRLAASQSQKWANDALIKGIESQEAQLKHDAENLTRLQRAAETAEGRMQAIQAANQLASNQAAQLLQIRSLLLAQQNAMVARFQAEMDKEAQQMAAHDRAVAITVNTQDRKGW